MGWSSGINYEGRTIGYVYPSVCEEKDCDTEIDLGLSYCCGDLEGVTGEQGCGHYFCYEHLFYGMDYEGQRCPACDDIEGREVTAA